MIPKVGPNDPNVMPFRVNITTAAITASEKAFVDRLHTMKP